MLRGRAGCGREGPRALSAGAWAAASPQSPSRRLAPVCVLTGLGAGSLNGTQTRIPGRARLAEPFSLDPAPRRAPG